MSYPYDVIYPNRRVGDKNPGSNEKCERAEMNFHKVENEVQNQEGDGKAIEVVQSNRSREVCGQ
jgi:hypothetical protein